MIIPILSADLSLVIEQCSKLTGNNFNKSQQISMLKATQDYEAVAAFLNEYKNSTLTLRSYRKEIERLLLWCINISKLNIASLTRDDLLAYQEFIKSPKPTNLWLGPKVPRKKGLAFNPAWRPFCQGLSTPSFNKAMTILDSFFNYLVQCNYLHGNPLALDKKRKKRKKTLQGQMIERYLELSEIKATLMALDNFVCNNTKQKFQVSRARYIILLLFFTGLRISEASQHQMKDFKLREKLWYLKVLGKGNKTRYIPIPDELLSALKVFRLSNNMGSSEPGFKELSPLIPMEDGKSSITDRRINQILKWAFNLGADSIEQEYPHQASKLRQASAHWLRHSYVTYLISNGASLKVAQDNAGHSNISTTLLYQHLEQLDRHAMTKTLSINLKNSI